MLLPLTGLLYVSFLETNRPRYWFYSGLLSALALLYKPICIYVIIGILGYSLIKMIKSKISFSDIAKFMLLFIFGFILSIVFILLPVYVNQAFKDFWEQAVIFNLMYAKHWGITFSALFLNLKAMARSFWLVYLILILGLFLKKVNRLFYLYLFLALLAVFQTSIRHYYLLLAPFTTLITISVLTSFKIRKLFLISFFILFISILYPIRQQFFLSPKELSLWIYGRDNPFYESKIVSDKLTEATKISDQVFVAGSEPQILYYAKRRSVTPFVITYPLIIDTPKRSDYQKKAVEDLRNNKPAAIVYSTRVHSGLWNEDSPRVFIDYLNDLIKKEYKLMGGYVWDQRGGYWLDQLKKEDLTNAGFILYKRR